LFYRVGMLRAAKLTAIVALLAGGGARPQAPPTFNRDVAPIIFSNCAACHHPGGSGPFSLLGYQDVRKRAAQIVEVTRSRYMPPWLPEPGHGDFAGARRLSDAELQVIEQWAAQGAAEGDAADLPPAPKYTAGWQLGRPDLIVKMPRPYILPAEGSDVFRNFVIPIPVAAARYVRAIEMLPGNRQLIHHANVLIDRAQVSRRRDAADPEVGFAGMDVAIESESFDPESHFLFWKPGTVPWVEPEGMAWRLDPGTDLVLNMHLQPSGKPESIQPEVGLYFTDRPPTRFPMLLQLERDGALDIPAGKRDFVIADEFRLPVDVDVLGIYPHAHYLGRELQGMATLPDGTQKWLIRIKRWDLDWQAVYRYAEPLFLPRGTVVSMRFTYDNSAANERNPNRPPRRVRAGDRATDEMGHLWLQVLPRAPGDGRLALQEALMRRRLEKYPADFTAHFNLGAVLQSLEKTEEAIGHFRQALQSRPADATAQNSLGAALQSLGRYDEALDHFRRALRARPDHLDARYNLANSLLARGQSGEAVTHLRAVLEKRPDDAGAHNSMGSALGMQGELAPAIAHYEQALRLKPDYADAHSNLGYALALQGKPAAAIGHYEEAVRLNPQDAEAHNALGILLAGQGKLAEAAAHFERAVQIKPGYDEARENLDRARRELGRRPE